MPVNLKTQQWPQDWKRSVFIPTPKKGNAKECSTYLTITFISHASKVMLIFFKNLQARLQQYMNWELPNVQGGFRNGRGTRDQIVNISWQQLEPDTEQQTGSKLKKEYIKAVYFHPAYLTYMQSISCKMPSWMNHKVESSLLGEVSTTSDIQVISEIYADDTTLMAESEEELKRLLMRV